MLLRAHPEDQNSLHFFNIQSSHSFFSSHVENGASSSGYVWLSVQALPYWQSSYAYELWRRLRCADQVRDHRPQPSPSDSHDVVVHLCVCPLSAFICGCCCWRHLFTLRESGKWSREQERRTCIIKLDEYPQHQRHLQSYRLASLRDYAFFLSYLSITPLCISKIRILNPNLSLRNISWLHVTSYATPTTWRIELCMWIMY